MSLASKYRPDSWDCVIGQDNIVTILKKQIETNSIKNTYIFSGSSGCGKTTVARIFANNINNGNGSPIEIDAASNSSVDNVREIVKLSSERSIDSVYKVYIIDECHSLSNQAWQAFLKCIEEPPKYTIFIFCTTEPSKIPDTIKNRCMRFNFYRINHELIYRNLITIAEKENASNIEETCDYISRICNGEMRNGISLLEKCLDYSNDINIDTALSCLGNYSYEVYLDLVNGMLDGDTSKVLNILNSIYKSGADLRKFLDTFLEFNLDITKYILYNSIENTKFPASLEDKIKYAISIENAKDYYFYFIDKLLDTKQMIKDDLDIKSTIEVMLVRMCRLI